MPVIVLHRTKTVLEQLSVRTLPAANQPPLALIGGLYQETVNICKYSFIKNYITKMLN